MLPAYRCGYVAFYSGISRIGARNSLAPIFLNFEEDAHKKLQRPQVCIHSSSSMFEVSPPIEIDSAVITFYEQPILTITFVIGPVYDL